MDISYFLTLTFCVWIHFYLRWYQYSLEDWSSLMLPFMAFTLLINLHILNSIVQSLISSEYQWIHCIYILLRTKAEIKSRKFLQNKTQEYIPCLLTSKRGSSSSLGDYGDKFTESIDWQSQKYVRNFLFQVVNNYV